MTSVFPLSDISLLQWIWLSQFEPLGEATASRDHADPSSEDGDHFLMARLQSGDDHAFSELFNKWKRPLISFFYRSLGDYHLSEDLALEVATKVYRARNQYQPRARFSTWLFKIARNSLLDRGRAMANRIHLETGESQGLGQWTYPETALSGNSERVRLWEDWLATALKSLPENEKSAVLLVAQQGLKPAEAAEIMQIQPNHLRVLLNKARNRLRKLREELL